MQYLDIPKIPIEDDASMEHIAGFMNRLKKHQLQFVPWQSFPYKPEVFFSIAYSGTGIFIRFSVFEKSIRAATNEINGPVWEDSCVEFFISFDDTGYYNFEFNCIGTPFAAFGTDRNNRFLISEDFMRDIRSHCKMHQEREGFAWEIAVRIPISSFAFHKLGNLRGRTAKGNFYKCGDKLPDPHFICWNEIQAPSPDFHLPQYFGVLNFQT